MNDTPMKPHRLNRELRQDIIAIRKAINDWCNARISENCFQHYPIDLIYNAINSKPEIVAFLAQHRHSEATISTSVWIVNNIIGSRIKSYIDSRNMH